MNLFECFKRSVETAPARFAVTMDLHEWERSGIQIAGYTKESPLKNLEAWATSQGYVFHVHPHIRKVEVYRLK